MVDAGERAAARSNDRQLPPRRWTLVEDVWDRSPGRQRLKPQAAKPPTGP